MHLIPELVFERSGDLILPKLQDPQPYTAGRITCPEDIGPIAIQRVGRAYRECAGMLMLDRDMTILAAARLAVGTRESVTFDPCEIIMHARALVRCAHLVLGHSHLHTPDPTPEDFKAFADLRLALEIAGYGFYDFCIATYPDGFYSFRRQGHFDATAPQRKTPSPHRPPPQKIQV